MQGMDAAVWLLEHLVCLGPRTSISVIYEANVVCQEASVIGINSVMLIWVGCVSDLNGRK